MHIDEENSLLKQLDELSSLISRIKEQQAKDIQPYYDHYTRIRSLLNPAPRVMDTREYLKMMRNGGVLIKKPG